MRAKSILGAVAGAIFVGLLVGCSGPATTTDPTAQPTTTPSASASSSASATPKDVLFTVSAKVRDKTGNTIAIELIAHKPLPYSDSSAKPLIAEFTNVCAASALPQSPITPEGLTARGAIFVSMDLTVSVPDKTFAYPINLEIGNAYYGVSATGKGISPVDPAAPCSNGYLWSRSGQAHVTAEFESDNPGPDLSQWKNSLYGFSVPPESKATIEACQITLTDKAREVVTDTPGWDAGAGNGVACTVGYVGE